MLSPVFTTVDLTAVEDAVGVDVYARGAQYARQHAVIRMEWNSAEGRLQGTVRGRTGDFFTATAYFSSFGGDGLELEHGECDCPVGFNCKHVVALVLTATEAERSQPAP
ncbi:MAG: SWIM zinc finger family protein, partial [Pseudonocardiaceae bacterium]